MLELWRQSRLIAYMQSTGKKEIWDFYPLPGDPTPAERIRMAMEGNEQKAKEDTSYHRATLDYFKEKFGI